MTRIALLLALLALGGCSDTLGRVATKGAEMALTGALGASEGPQLDIATQVGKENTKNDFIGTLEEVQGDKNTVGAEKVETINIQQVPLYFLLIAILGWMLPSPGEIYREVKRWFGG